MPRRTSGTAPLKPRGNQKSPAASVRGRPPRLAHLLSGSPARQRHERALAALLGPMPPAMQAVAAPPIIDQPGEAADILTLPNPEWLSHLLTVTGPATDLAAFREAARGPGIIAWCNDTDRDREAWTAQLLALSAKRFDLSAESARVLAREMSEVMANLDLAAADRTARRTCPFDLNALLPLPAHLLRLGPESAAVVAWLWQHWGTTWMLRGVEEVAPGSAERLMTAGHAALALRFWSADWTPWRALQAVRARWPTLGLHVRVLPVNE